MSPSASLCMHLCVCVCVCASSGVSEYTIYIYTCMYSACLDPIFTTAKAPEMNIEARKGVHVL